MAERDSARSQMAMDEDLAARGQATLRLFRWVRPAVSMGYRQPRPAWTEPALLEASGIESIERPTGGRVAVHGSDLSCSVTLPRSASTSLSLIMDLVCESLGRACRSLGISVSRGEESGSKPIVYCLVEPSPYALMVGSRKLAGFAVRRYAMSWLIQGSMLVRGVPAVFEQVMPRDVSGRFLTQSISLEEAVGAPVGWTTLIPRVAEAWQATWGLPCSLVDEGWAGDGAAWWPSRPRGHLGG